jgi:hypothetical protein
VAGVTTVTPLERADRRPWSSRAATENRYSEVRDRVEMVAVVTLPTFTCQTMSLNAWV